MMEGEDDSAVGFGEETWKYRKEASILGAALVRACPDDFVSAIFNGKSESTGLALKDSDVGAKKKDILDLLVSIVIAFNKEIDTGITNQ